MSQAETVRFIGLGLGLELGLSFRPRGKVKVGIKVGIKVRARKHGCVRVRGKVVGQGWFGFGVRGSVGGREQQ